MQLPDELLFALQFPRSLPSASALTRLLNTPELKDKLRQGFADALNVDVNSVEIVYADDPAGMYYFPRPFGPIPGPNPGIRRLLQLRGRGVQQRHAAVTAAAVAAASALAASERGDIVVLGVTGITCLGAMSRGSSYSASYSGLTEAQTVEDITTRLHNVFDAGIEVSPGLADFATAWGPSASNIELIGVKAPLPGSGFTLAAGLAAAEQPASAAAGSEWPLLFGVSFGLLALGAVIAGVRRHTCWQRQGRRDAPLQSPFYPAAPPPAAVPDFEQANPAGVPRYGGRGQGSRI